MTPNVPVSTSRDTFMPRIKLPVGNVPGLMVPPLKQCVSKVTVPLISKLPSELALSAMSPVTLKDLSEDWKVPFSRLPI
jgi:hypothetical protein